MFDNDSLSMRTCGHIYVISWWARLILRYTRAHTHFIFVDYQHEACVPDTQPDTSVFGRLLRSYLTAQHRGYFYRDR